MLPPTTLDSRPDLRDLTHPELEAFVAEQGEQRFRADQLYRWLHGRGATSTAEMTNLARDLRLHFAEIARITTLDLEEARQSEDGSAKFAFRTPDGELIESVLMPEASKATVCLSSQVGCGLGCTFCATARLGLRRSLSAAEIVDQLYRIRAWMAVQQNERRLSNVVYMGMGEPLVNLRATLRSLEMLMHPLGANLSSRRITVSTAGVIPGLRRLAESPVRVNLAVSLNAADQATRARLMPIAAQYPLAELLAALRAFPLERRRRITFEYVLIAGLNDRDEDAAQLPRLVKGIPCKFNVIGFNPIKDCPYSASPPARVASFCEILRRAGHTVVLRQSRGLDVAAACGQLAGQLGVRAPDAGPTKPDPK